MAPFPDRIRPMLAHTGAYPAHDASYAFEIKWDGYRGIVYHDEARLWIRTRNQNDITTKFPELAELGEILRGRRAVLDGEIVAFGANGLPNFQALQTHETPVAFVAFDVLHLDGLDTTKQPYEERRALLEDLGVKGKHAQITPASVGGGRALLAMPGLEGVVAKRLDSAYLPGARSLAWIKIKTTKRQEFVIGGWTKGQGSRGGSLGALLVGVYEGEKLRYAGSVGTGFSERGLDALVKAMMPLRRKTSPFVDPIDKAEVVFIEPRLVGEVEFTEWTRDGRLRHPSFKGLRDDKEPRSVLREER